MELNQLMTTLNNWENATGEEGCKISWKEAKGCSAAYIGLIAPLPTNLLILARIIRQFIIFTFPE